jgi:metal-sulfur cluster biosynthetic enzyme
MEAGPFTLGKVIEKLKTVSDPEIPVNVVDRGLIYACEAHPLADGGYRVEMKMTAPGCGMGDVVKADACRKEEVAGVTEVDTEIVWEPAWDQNRMSEAAKLQFGLLLRRRGDVDRNRRCDR